MKSPYSFLLLCLLVSCSGGDGEYYIGDKVAIGNDVIIEVVDVTNISETVSQKASEIKSIIPENEYILLVLLAIKNNGGASFITPEAPYLFNDLGMKKTFLTNPIFNSDQTYTPGLPVSKGREYISALNYLVSKDSKSFYLQFKTEDDYVDIELSRRP